MGSAPEIQEGLRLTRAELDEQERQYDLDTEQGQLKKRPTPNDDPLAQPQPVRVAPYTYD